MRRQGNEGCVCHCSCGLMLWMGWGRGGVRVVLLARLRRLSLPAGPLVPAASQPPSNPPTQRASLPACVNALSPASHIHLPSPPPHLPNAWLTADLVGETIPMHPVLRIKGTVVKGFGRGSKDLGVPTANVDADSLRGVLAEAVTGGRGRQRQRRRGMASCEWAMCTTTWLG